jgi:hypothetical protein
MERLNIPSELPKEAQIMYERMPEQLKRELSQLPVGKMLPVLQAVNRLHRAMEAEVYALTLRLVQAVR